LKKRHFKVDRQDSSLIAEYGKPGRLSATITHIGLLTLLAGVTVTSWTGFSGFAPVKPGKSLSFSESEHSKLWIGKLPQWQVRVESTARENYPTGQPKQWYSDLSVVDGDGRVLKSGQISVNNPLTYEGVDIYQASWGLAAIEVAFSGQVKEMNLEQMGNRYASFLPLDKDSILIFSVSDQKSPLRLFAKRTEWETPKRIAEIKPGESIDLGGVKLLFKRVIPITGLQYKCDPGINIVFVGFAFIITGVMLAAIPFRHVWAHAAKIDDNETETALKIPVDTILYIGGRSIKARVGFEIMLEQIIASQFGDGIQVDPQSGSECDSRSSNDEKLLALGSRENSD
ncbi:MAG: cytochrome c biogenesis protein ResB, partial [Candidatus Obscuribacterales bacterium]|nr:cytochrome c biogenesis protein ResB [Candidatus Obscuribacterales bacterium]